MANDKPSHANAETLGKQLKQSLSTHRPRTTKILVLALLTSVILLSLLAWWLYPRTSTPPLHVVAFDLLYTSEQTPLARAELLIGSDEEPPTTWQGHTVVFRFAGNIGTKPVEVIAKSNHMGQAFVDAPTKGSASTEFLAQYVDSAAKRVSTIDSGRIFVWPKDAPLLLVDLKETIMTGDADKAASPALQTAMKNGWRVVYLTFAYDAEHDLRAARFWLEKHPALPRGPILTGSPYRENVEVTAARQNVLADLKSRFSGPLFVVVGADDTAIACNELGFRTILIGKSAPAGILHAPTWADVSAHLK